MSLVVHPPQADTIGKRIDRYLGELYIAIGTVLFGVLSLLHMTILRRHGMGVFFGPILEREQSSWGWMLTGLMLAGGVGWALVILVRVESMDWYWPIKQAALLITVAAWAEYCTACWDHPAGVYMGGLIFPGGFWIVAGYRLVQALRIANHIEIQHSDAEIARGKESAHGSF